jgi:lipoic acid synthetase
MNPNQKSKATPRKPPWLKKKLVAGKTYEKVQRLLRNSQLHTVCEEARCPNLDECFARKTATFLILGDRCTRNCRFCSIAHGPSGPPDAGEPRKVADAVHNLGLLYVVITSVTRDDLPDGGAAHFAHTIQAIRLRVPDALVEVLVPDFGGNVSAIETLVNAHPDVINHNMETVPSLYSRVRPGADYKRSLGLLEKVGRLDSDILTKSGVMLGLGETGEEIHQVLSDLLEANCRILTLGQYLQPSPGQLPVERYIPPQEFEHWKTVALEMGFQQVASGPFVRSSYHAGELFNTLNKSGRY